MSREWVSIIDDHGDDVGGYVDVNVKEEPDCYDCNDAGCPDGCGTTPPPSAATPGADDVTDPWGPSTGGGWGGYSTEPPY